MAIVTNTNVSSLNAQKNLNQTQLMVAKSFQRLSSGYRINSAADDAAGLGIATLMNSQVRSLSVAERNANDGISMLQVADGAGSTLASLLTRMRELAVQSANGTLTTSNRNDLSTEFSALQAEISRIASGVNFNTVNLLSGTAFQISFQIGYGTASSDMLAVSFGGLDGSSLGVSALTVTTVAGAQAAMGLIDTAIASLNTSRAIFGAAMNRLAYTVTNLQNMQENLSAAHSRIRDVDVASETSALTKNQVLQQAGAAILAQANQEPQIALTLLGGAR